MHPIAEELNQSLAPTIVGRVLSSFGQRIYFPKGIVAQSNEAKKSATTLNATVGVALVDGEPMILPTIQDNLPRLSPSESIDYAPTGGDPRLRAVWKEEMLRKNPDLSAEHISLPLVVPGITSGISLAADLFVDSGDVVVFTDLCWDNYPLIFETRCEGDCRTFPTFRANGTFNCDGLADAVRSAPASSKVIIVLNFPHNPTGYSPSVAEAKELAQYLTTLADEGRDLVVLCDDAYFGLFYDESACRQSLFSLLFRAHSRLLAVKVDGATKEDFVWGFRVGFLTFGSKDLQTEHFEALNQKILGTIRTTISSSSRVGQTLLYRELSSLVYHGIKLKYAKVLEERFQTVKRLIESRTSGKSLQPLPFNSGYFMTFELLRGRAEDLRRTLLRDEGIGTIALQDRFLRIAYSSIDNRDLKDLYDTIFRVADALFGP